MIVIQHGCFKRTKKGVETEPFDLLLRLTVNIFNESDEKNQIKEGYCSKNNTFNQRQSVQEGKWKIT